MFYALITFLPLYWSRILRQSRFAGGITLTIFFTMGALSTLLGGRLADRVGYRKIMQAGFAPAHPLFFLFLRVPNALVATVLLAPIALTFYAPFSAMVVLGQQYLPNRVGFASGVTLGLSVSIGGAMAPLLGRLADVHGIPFSLTLVGLLPILTMLIAFILPAPRLLAKEKTAAGAATA